MSENEVKTITPWTSWRTTRLLKMLEYKAQGLTDAEVAAKPDMPSAATVSRELNSPQAAQIGKELIERATAMIWPLIEKQIYQIETDELTSGQRINFRGGLINSLFKLVPQRIDANVKGEGMAPIVISFHKDTELKYPEKKEEPEGDQ